MKRSRKRGEKSIKREAGKIRKGNGRINLLVLIAAAKFLSVGFPSSENM